MSEKGPGHDNYGALLSILAKYGYGKSFLQVGARPKGSWFNMKNHFFHGGCERHDILEIFPKNAEAIQNQSSKFPVGGNIITGDVLKITEYKSLLPVYDWILWWHGPEHVEDTNFRRILPTLLEKVNIGIIVGCPFGRQYQGPEYGNKNEEHISAWYPDDFEALKFSVYTYGLDAQGTLVAYRIKE